MHHVRLGRYQLERGATADVVERIRRELVPWVRDLDGFVAYDLVTTPHDGLITYSIWRSKRCAQDAAGIIKKWIDDNLADRILDIELHIGDLAFTERRAEPEVV